MISQTKKVLVVDDETKIVEVVHSYLKNSGFDVYDAFTGKQALKLLDEIKPDLVVLDLMLPDMTGEEICKTIRKTSRIPIIMLTAKVEEADILQGLDIGADDYMIKPFSPKQLVARVIAVLRRVSDDPVTLSNTLSYHDGDLEIDNLKYEVKKQGVQANLTPKEYKILMTLIKYPKKTFTREELITMALGDDFDGYERTVDTHIKNLRQKIETDPKSPIYIVTIHGIGYRFGGE